MSILRKSALLMVMVFGLTLLPALPAGASGADGKGRQGDIKVCKVLKEANDRKDATFNFVIREKKKEGDKDKYKFDITFYKGEHEKKCKEFTVDKGAYVVREKGMAPGYKLHDIDVKGCYYKDRNDKDAKVEVDVKDKKCTVTFTNKKKDR